MLITALRKRLQYLVLLCSFSLLSSWLLSSVFAFNKALCLLSHRFSVVDLLRSIYHSWSLITGSAHPIHLSVSRLLLPVLKWVLSRIGTIFFCIWHLPFSYHTLPFYMPYNIFYSFRWFIAYLSRRQIVKGYRFFRNESRRFKMMSERMEAKWIVCSSLEWGRCQILAGCSETVFLPRHCCYRIRMSKVWWS